ncbi:hypothetical protein G7Z17_g11323 [Cylindrodendrum hubeiense]|uniref:Inner centromere protein ARK-binding domain-containing protein n=1 Tax=Cylindrodendrum hubeiense TaxID=595255 RepID=A0A9P5H107_9HYPO|nr:hypothetical protein G7Z17_g11323 [Cylindrodendrum hubeiense]
MAAMRGPRLQVGSAAWVAEERASALQIADSEVEEFTYSARNELDWLNEHMAGIFNENETNIAETFKTPGKLRGKTPRTARKVLPGEPRVPLSNVFGATPTSTANRFAQQLSKTQSPRLQPGSPSPVKTASPRRDVFSPKPTQTQPATQDSGFYGSQDVGSMDVDLDEGDMSQVDHVALHAPTTVPVKQSPSRTTALESPDKTFRTAKEDQTTRVLVGPNTAVTPSPAQAQEASEHDDVVTSPLASRHASPIPSSPAKTYHETETIDEVEQVETQPDEVSPGEARSASDGSSPIRPVVRKSSLNFASLPAREPLTAGKITGARVSRTSHLDHNRTSYYNRHTGGKSLGNYAKQDSSDDEDQDDDDMDVDDFPSVPAQESQEPEDLAVHHNKTYTQRLQDQINMLGKSQPNGDRPSKSFHNGASLQPQASTAPQPAQEPTSPSPRKQEMTTTPGAFPEDDDDDWIDPPAVEHASPERANLRPTLPKSHSTDVMEGIHGKDIASTSGATQAELQEKTRSPIHRGLIMPQRPSILGHGKSASVSVIPTTSSFEHQDGSPLKKTVSVSNSSLAMETVLEKTRSQTPSKSPSRSFRDSPLKQVKNKLSSILKSSKGLLASSAAISAEGKSSMLSPSTTRLGTYTATSTESVVQKGSHESLRIEMESPARPAPRRTRASVEREKEEKRREREAMHMAEQMDKLEKAREKEREKVRVFSKEQEKIAAMEKQVASKKETENTAPKETPKPTRTSPRKAKAQQTATNSSDQDLDMADVPFTIPPSAPRSAGPGQSTRTKEVRKPLKPGKTKQAPTVIRVNTGSQHSQFQPTSSTMSSSFQDTMGSTSSQPQQHLGSKASKASLQPKPSMQSLKSSVSSTGRPKALDMAARKKEQDEREAQRRRDAKAEFERKRAAAQEEQRKQELQRRQEAERQKLKEREQADVKKNSQRQAAIEKAKQTRAPPPAVRSQPNGPPDHNTTHDKSQRDDRPPTRPPSRMNSGIFRSQEDTGRPVNAVLSNTSKAVLKRALGQDGNEPSQARHAPSYGGSQYQAKDAKRRRTSDEFADELEMDNPPNIKGPPVRPSGGFKKAKSMFQNGYSNVPQSATRDLFKATVTAQHTSQTKASHPLDMAQISKGAIPFAPNPNPAGQSYKTPARPGAMNGAKSAAKSALRSSPRFQNGESIELPEIMTDDDDDDDDDEAHGMTAAAWADSPDLRRALMRQEMMDPSQIFGPPAPLNMDEVFSKSKDRTHKFRPRTSSANWSGADRLTEEDIRKDLQARDKMRREGGWTYEMSREMM